MCCEIKGFSSKNLQKEYKLLAHTTEIRPHKEGGEHVDEEGGICAWRWLSKKRVLRELSITC